LRRGERVVDAVGGVAALVALFVGVETSLPFGHLLVVGGVLHVLPMGLDVVADVVLVLRDRAQ